MTTKAAQSSGEPQPIGTPIDDGRKALATCARRADACPGLKSNTLALSLTRAFSCSTNPQPPREGNMSKSFKPFSVGTIRGPYSCGKGNDPLGGVQFAVRLKDGSWACAIEAANREKEARERAEEISKAELP